MLRYFSAIASLFCAAGIVCGAETVSTAASYKVWLPQSADPVVYDIVLYQQDAPTDTLAPCNYLIEWSAQTPSGPSAGFNAYFQGNHYRYRDHRLQEYHYALDRAPFDALGARSRGVQQSAQFADLLPAFIDRYIANATTDSNSTVTRTVRADGSTRIRVVESANGLTAREGEYTFDADGLPVAISIESSPGSIAEQSVEVAYHRLSDSLPPLTEDLLLARYPEVFSKYRNSTFRLDNLPGTPLPSYAVPSADGTRLIHQRGQTLAHPTIIVFLDPSVASTPTVVNDIRQAVASLPMTVDVMWVFTATNPSEALDAVSPRPGESLAVNASSLFTDCGVAQTPAVVMVNSDGIIENVVAAYNPDLASIVITKALLLH